MKTSKPIETCGEYEYRMVPVVPGLKERRLVEDMNLAEGWELAFADITVSGSLCLFRRLVKKD